MGNINYKRDLKGHTLLNRRRCSNLYVLALKIQKLRLEGDVAEVGVYKGGSAKLLANVFNNKTVHLFDTFSGHPSIVKKIDGKRQWIGKYNDVSFQEVKKYLSNNKNVVLYKGVFSKTAEYIKNKIFCFVHVDCDIYQSVMDCCNFFYPRLVPNGVMLFDDYTSSSCPGANKAVKEFIQDKFENLTSYGHKRYLTKGKMWKQ